MGRRLAMHEHDAPQRTSIAHALGEREQPSLIGLRAEAVEHEDLGAPGVRKAEDTDLSSLLCEPSVQCVRGLEPTMATVFLESPIVAPRW